MKNVADIYALSPMQKLMLLHAKTTGGGHDVLFNQIVYQISGDLEHGNYQRAWQNLADRHPALRTLFVWQDGKEPLQVVRETALLSWREHDWRDRSESDQAIALDELLDADRAAGFDLLRAPLMRLQLIRTGQEAHWLVWSSHHLIIDRWCIGIILSEIKEIYESDGRGQRPSLPPAPRYRDYIAWLAEQDEREARAFWRERLQDLQTRPLPLRDAQPGSAPQLDTLTLSLDVEETTSLRQFAADHDLTLSTLLKGAWAILLSRLTGSADVLFGLTVSGRPPELPQMAQAVGCFINNVPLRVTLDVQKPLAAWLAELQDQQLALQPYEYASPAQIQEWSGLKTAGPLFDTLVVHQAPFALPRPADLDLRFARGGMQTGYPLTLGVVPREERLRLTLTYDRQRLAQEAAGQIGTSLRWLLEEMTRGPQEPAVALRERLPVQRLEKGSAAETGNGAAVVQTYVPPRTAVEQALVQVWAEVLDLPRVSVEDRFFDLGGDSVKALGLLAGVERRLGSSMPITLLFSNPTLAEMAEAMHERHTGAGLDPVLLPVNQNGSRRPFFYAHGVFGDISSLTNVVPLLPAAQPLYGLQAVGLNPQQQPDRTIEAMASHYVEAIKRAQPNGPYRLGGFCFGGVVAYETARQLEQAGDVVSLLAIIEGSAPRRYHQPAPLLAPQRLNIMRHSAPQILRGNQEFGGWRLRQRWQKRFGGNGGSGRKGSKGQARDEWDGEFDNLADFNASRPEIQQRLRDINVRAIEQYDPPGPVAARLTLFRARWLPVGHTIFGQIDPARGWGQLAQGGVDIRYVDGSHIGILRQPHAAKLAEALAEALQETDATSS